MNNYPYYIKDGISYNLSAMDTERNIDIISFSYEDEDDRLSFYKTLNFRMKTQRDAINFPLYFLKCIKRNY